MWDTKNCIVKPKYSSYYIYSDTVRYNTAKYQ